MSDSAALVCFRCKLVLPIGMFRRSAEPRRLFLDERLCQDDVPITQAVWKFLAEHVYHQTELLGEGDEDRWELINRDFTTIDDDDFGSPTLGEYIGHWPGGALAQHPRPMAEEVALVLPPPGSRALRQSLGLADVNVVKTLYQATRWPEDPSDEVDDAALAERLGKIWADQGFADRLVEWSHTILGRELEIVRKTPDQRGFQVRPKRWAVERTFSWVTANRRLARDCEQQPACSETMIRWA